MSCKILYRASKNSAAGLCRVTETARRSASSGACGRKMAVADVVLLLKYNVDLIPADGPQILASLAAPVKHIGKDAAGHKFHNFALLQRGVISESQKLSSELMHSSSMRICFTALTLRSLYFHCVDFAMMQALSRLLRLSDK